MSAHITFVYTPIWGGSKSICKTFAVHTLAIERLYLFGAHSRLAFRFRGYWICYFIEFPLGITKKFLNSKGCSSA